MKLSSVQFARGGFQRLWSQEATGRGLKKAKALAKDESGATTLEWALLLAAIAIPSYYIMMMSFNLLVEHYRMITLVNSLPFP